MQYTTSMKLENDAKWEIKRELISAGDAIAYIGRNQNQLLGKQDQQLSDEIKIADRNVWDLINILRGPYELEGLLLVLFDNTLRECRGQMRRLIKALTDSSSLESPYQYEKDVITSILRNALENIERLFTLYRE